MKLEIIHTPSLQEQVGRFVKSHRLLFNSAEWLQNYEANSVVQCAILNNNQEVIGCFFYFVFYKAGFKCIINPPFSPHIGLFYINPAESVVSRHSFDKELLTLVADHFNAQNASFIKVNFPSRVIDMQPFTWKRFAVTSRYTYLIDLSLPEEELHKNLSSEKRKSLNKAQKDGLEIREESGNYDVTHRLILQTLDRNGLVKNREIIQHILSHFSNPANAFAFVAYHQSVPVSAAFCVYTGSQAVYLFGGFNDENRHHGGGVSCMWNCILKAKALGLKQFDFEGSMNEDIERYFREFGGKLTPVFEITKAKFPVKQLMRLKNK